MVLCWLSRKLHIRVKFWNQLLRKYIKFLGDCLLINLWRFKIKFEKRLGKIHSCCPSLFFWSELITVLRKKSYFTKFFFYLGLHFESILLYKGIHIDSMWYEIQVFFLEWLLLKKNELMNKARCCLKTTWKKLEFNV